MRFRLMAAAILFHGDDMLMMKRPLTRTLSPGMWATVGGHVEPNELANPRAACLREIEEETGLNESCLEHFRLQYLLIRRYQDEIRQQFIYVGRATKREVIECDEGELHWIPRTEVLNRNMSYIFRATMEHYFSHGPSDHLWVATSELSGKDGDRPNIRWSPLEDYGIL